MAIRGTARVGPVTKHLVRRLSPGEIAVIDHGELDDVAAHALLESRVKAVINASPSMSERYPNGGPLTLVSSGVTLVDNVGREIMSIVRDGQTIEISGGRVICGKKVVAAGKILGAGEIRERMELSKAGMQGLIMDFVCNTLDYARSELGLITGDYDIPDIETSLKGRHVLIVVRGHNYKEDLNVVRPYIEEMKPVLIGVDGGADALRELGYRPHIIVGDMDSVSDATLSSGAELVSHAYSNGHSPAMERLKKMGLSSKVFSAPGTSEDIAMLTAYEKGAGLIVLVGSHSSIQDFLEKGRKGMASTMLVRLKVGSILVDAKGVGKLYKNKVKAGHLAQIVLAAMLPAVLVAFLSPPMRDLLRLLYLQCRICLGI
ncbi:MAG: putative cytokinetic ring protein SteA [Bacillota bacterium]